MCQERLGEGGVSEGPQPRPHCGSPTLLNGPVRQSVLGWIPVLKQRVEGLSGGGLCPLSWGPLVISETLPLLVGCEIAQLGLVLPQPAELTEPGPPPQDSTNHSTSLLPSPLPIVSTL